MIVQKIFYQFLRFKKLLRFRFINENFLKLLVLTQVSMGVIITSVRPQLHITIIMKSVTVKGLTHNELTKGWVPLNIFTRVWIIIKNQT